jgi:phage terminase large subunit GpA-like protein
MDEEKAGYCHFPLDTRDYERGYDEKYFEGLTSEVKVTKMVKGRPQTEWKLKTGMRNEPLDIRVYNMAAIEIMNPNFEVLKKRKGAKPAPPRKRRGTVSKGVDV